MDEGTTARLADRFAGTTVTQAVTGTIAGFTRWDDQWMSFL
jgi:hypothetical protein